MRRAHQTLPGAPHRQPVRTGERTRRTDRRGELSENCLERLLHEGSSERMLLGAPAG